MQFSPNEIVQFFVATQCLLFSVILLTDKGKKRTANYFLASFLLMLCAQMSLILSEKWVADYQPLSKFLCLFGFAYGPLLYFYTLHLGYRDFKLRWMHWLHSGPFVIMLVAGGLGYGLCQRVGSLLYVSLIIYVLLSIRQILAYRQVVKNTRSTIHRVNLSWLQWTLIIFTITLLVDIYSHFYNEIEPIPGVSVVNISLLVLINGVFYKGMKQPEIFQGVSHEDEKLSQPVEQTNVQFDQEADTIRQYFDAEAPYREADLTLAQLAAQLNMPVRRLSEVINRHFGQNFMDFVNTHRIDYAMKRLKEPIDPKETIAEVMYDAGFNSKSSFNTLFKKKTGQTPSQYKNSD